MFLPNNGVMSGVFFVFFGKGGLSKRTGRTLSLRTTRGWVCENPGTSVLICGWDMFLPNNGVMSGAFLFFSERVVDRFL
jgi:hypothetical protein